MDPGPSCLIAGSSNTTLQVGRSLGRAGIEVYYLCHGGPGDQVRKGAGPGNGNNGLEGIKDSIRALQVSRYTSGIHIHDGEESYPDTIWKVNEELGSPVIILTGDDFLLRHVKHWEELSGLGLKTTLPSRETLMDALDKLRLARAAQSSSVPVPGTRPLDQKHQNTPDQLKLPVIIKPRTSAGSFTRLGAKGFICRSPGEIADIARWAHSLSEPMIIQEYIPGPTKNLWKYNAIMDKKHRPVSEFCFQKIAQYPPGAGVACISRSAHRQDLVKTAREMLGQMGWVGAVNIEFKEDPGDGVLKLIEINPRPYLGIGQPAALGVNLPLALYELGTGTTTGSTHRSPHSSQPQYPDDHYYINPLLLASLLKIEVKRSPRETPGILRHLLHRNMDLDVWAFDDPEPFYIYAGKRAKAMVRRTRDMKTKKITGTHTRQLSAALTNIITGWNRR